ncbi:tryptophan halogenase family protein [Oceanicoccus sp. KOV_DT_Chl]|uniref:tryptophan halogenase family protein n=1 Tax=Oceanicoccus sp. KOV_DT_Chl TaxID=1904639 RepID=UPI00190E662E|nr:tryptophan halogenase family protein [Oceanicoccus sp. KOV_DT_Chl]
MIVFAGVFTPAFLFVLLKVRVMSIPEKIVIVGGGTAGWMSAMLLNHAWKDAGCKVTLIESSDIGIIGVGEGSTPYMRKFFEKLGIAEEEWMPACNATYKCGISFPGWSTKRGFESYFHPFFSEWDGPMAEAFFHNCTVRRRGYDAPAHPDDYFLAAALSRNFQAPISIGSLPAKQDYAYHFDAGLLGSFLKRKAIEGGVIHVVGNVIDIPLEVNGDISHLETDCVGILNADLFVDCSGFIGLLINKALKEPFISFSENLFNDSAVAIPSRITDFKNIPSETQSSALSCGWAWKIPLTNRFGNGYVYSSDYLSADAAEAELRRHIGDSGTDQEARHIKMRVGRIKNHWRNNCLAVGLSQGFIEPLEATALGLVQYTLEEFIKQYKKNEKNYNKFNDLVNHAFEETRDYIVLHYKLNTREDSKYWIDNRNNKNISEKLQRIINSWDSGIDFEAEAKSQAYTLPSWYCIFSGMGRFPDQLNKPPEGYVAPMAQAKEMSEKLSEYFVSHAKILGISDPSL